MTDPDEPILQRPESAPEAGSPLAEVIRRLVASEPYAVLCTQGDGQPYGSVIAFSMDPSLHFAVFATARETRKYRLIEGNDRVALVIDSRGRHPDELMTVEAVTATGRARELADEDDAVPVTELLVTRHPYLRDFVAAPTTAVFRVDIVRYLHVTRFQEVRQWTPE